MNDLITAIILSASGYVAFLAIGIGCLIWYNIWNLKNMEENFESDEADSAAAEKPEAWLESGTTSWDGSWDRSSRGRSTLDSMGRSSYAMSQRQQQRASSTPSLSESARHDVYAGRRKSTTLSTLVEDTDENTTGLKFGAGRLMRALRRRDTWEQ